ncbi:serine/threonine-protein kinase LATS1 isoform X2 [Latimeria chalumnae]|uniref:serine/threonine-protein kinase LATS1 isoform X2 n=1 Tax=Latimeria chalumnae TaxID=7897 RepID=UPI0006D8EF6D|nr:PREDICTED: serine/threonine-protein kinase LATS1 isoform X2 [Latimeria chalumnae]|eukprot:XP_014350966.1 PREDICTED: serine/threonine-protein kinase LATS1 isoform X2 [Latimeria chalumnae]
MKRGEKPEGYRQMRPKTFPASNYTGSSRQMLQEIRESLRNLPKPSDTTKVEQNAVKLAAEDPRHPGRAPPKFGTHHKALQEIRNSLLPFANETNSSARGASEVNRKMLQDLQAAGFDEDMVIRALRQTNSRSLEAAIEYISKMSYQDPRREQMVAVVNAGMKLPGPGGVQSVNRKQSWKGSKESLVPQRHGPSMVDSVVYRSESPSSQTEMVRPLSGSGLAAFTQGHPGNGQRVNPPPPPQVRSVTPPPPPPRGQTPPPRGTTPPPPSWDPNSQPKRYSGSIEYVIPRISPVPQGAWQDGYSASAMNTSPMMNPSPQGQRGISPVPVGRQPIIMHGSANNKFSFPSGRAGLQNGGGQPDFMAHQNVIGSNQVNRQPPPPYPVGQTNRQSPTALQMQAGGSAASSTYTNGNIPQSMIVPNRNSHNMDVYNLSIPGMQTSWSQLSSTQPQSQSCNGHEIPTWQHNIPVRSSSFNTHLLANRQTHPASSQPSATTVTAITQAPILQPVKSMRVPKPELQTALAPTHPPWVQQSMQAAQPSPFPDGPSVVPQVTDTPSYQGPPPPYPKHLLQQIQPAPPYDSAAKPGKEDAGALAQGRREEDESEVASEVVVDGAGREKKQITTSPVPVRKNKRDEERRESRIQLYSPQAFKFYMEQHVENILKCHHQRLHRQKQLENEMMRLI